MAVSLGRRNHERDVDIEYEAGTKIDGPWPHTLPCKRPRTPNLLGKRSAPELRREWLPLWERPGS